jgi:hypothetical protein
LGKIQGLKAAFDARKDYFTNRTSCVFPVMLRPNTDLHIVYLNYWTLKNDIPKEKIIINFRIYNSSGNAVLKFSKQMENGHNQCSIRHLIKDHTNCNLNNFDGMVEVEIISLHNLRFPFPGIVGIFQANKLFSAVHSAGRIKNSDEVQRISLTEETNWTCKFGTKVTPFFHYFNGPTLPQKDTITVKLRKRNGAIIDIIELSIAHLLPFGSQIFFITDLFPLSNYEKDLFVSVCVEHNSIFPRMVVGNYFYDSDFLEVTHSFPIIEKEDYCPIQPEDKFQSILPAYTSPELTLSVHVFPTNYPGFFKAFEATKDFGTMSLKERASLLKINGEPFESYTFNLKNEEQFLCLRLQGTKVPSRFNASYRYKVKDTRSIYSTDIADGADSCVYPPKYRHWGYGYLGDEYETVVLVRNNSHRPEDTQQGIGRLRVFSSLTEICIPVKIRAEASISINLSEYISGPIFEQTTSKEFISWILDMDISSCETFWIAFRKKDGAIMGDHGM